MASQGHYLITNSVDDTNALLSALEQAARLAERIVQRMEALGLDALEGYAWPEGYTENDFVALYQALDALPGLVVADDVRDKLFALVSFIQ